MSEFEEHYYEMQRVQQAEYDKIIQKSQADKLEIEIFIGSLAPNQLVTLHKMMTTAISDNDCGWQLTGVITGALVWKHGRAWDGGESLLADGATSLAYKMYQAAGEPMNDLDRIEKDRADKTAALMKEYDVVPKPGTDYFECGNCGAFILSLEDRMIKPPGVRGCPGCIEKAKFG